MILHLAPDYMNTPLYSNLFRALASLDKPSEQFVCVCDNHTHPADKLQDNVYLVNRKFNLIERALFFPKQRYLLSQIEQHAPLKETRIIHAHTLFSSGYLAYQLHKKYGIPYIVAIRNTDVNVFFRYMPHLHHIGRQIAEHAERVVFISPAYRRQVIGNYLPESIEEKTAVIPNGIDKLFLENISRHTPSADILRLIYVGRLEKAKNIDTIIRTADLLRQQGHQVQLCLVGKIVEKRYQDLIAKRSYITWHDQCPQQEVLKYLRENDIFVMPSYKETFGLVYAEAMSQGLPVIYTTGQGFDGFFEDGYVGYSAQPDAIEYIANKILDIKNDYACLSEHCIQQVQLFDWEQIAVKYNQIYQENMHHATC